MPYRETGESDFETVLAAARAHEAWALERLYTTLAPAVAGFLRLQSAAEPDDLTSEVFVGVLRNLSTFRGDEGHFRSWVFTIAYRRLTDERRASAGGRRCSRSTTRPIRSIRATSRPTWSACWRPTGCATCAPPCPRYSAT